MRNYRSFSMMLGLAALCILTLVTDPYFEKTFSGVIFGGKLVMILRTLSMFGIAALVVHLGRKTIADYVDLSKLVTKASEEPRSAGLAIIGIAIYTVAFAIIFTSLATLI